MGNGEILRISASRAGDVGVDLIDPEDISEDGGDVTTDDDTDGGL